VGIPADLKSLQPGLYDSATEVRRRNAELDAQLRALAKQIPESSLHDELSECRRTLAEQLGHLAESATFSNRQLDEWLAGHRIILGRVASVDPDFHDGMARATERRLQPLVDALEHSLQELDANLGRLHRGHLKATTHHVVFGREPLTSYLDRYVIRHKTAHARELKDALEFV
jgi:hypothetical protein